MIGSPDLLVFTGGEGFDVEATYHQDTPALPNELSIPLEPPSNPWTTAAKFHRDFVLIAEFSEQVGPQPVMTIPEDPRVLGSFDLNHFSVRIMSVDYQAAFPAAAAASAYPGPRINFAEDSRVVMGDSADGAFAYVQHMTLYDLEARGFVRPFCMAYVSSDRRKLMEHFGELSARFTQASDSLKTGNRRAFAAELQRKLQQLEYMRLTQQQQGAGLQDPADRPPGAGEEPGDDNDGPGALERSILNFRDLLRQVTAYPNRKLKQPGFLPYDPADGVGDPRGPSPPAVVYPACFSSSSSSSSGGARLERRLKTLEELSDAYFLSVTVDRLTDTERRLRGDRGALLSARLIRDYRRGLPLTHFLFEHRDPEEEEEEEEEDGGEQQQQQEAVAAVAKEDKGAWPSLESFFSCVQELPIKLEAETEGRRRSPPAPGPEEEGAAAEMAGSVSSGDSIEVLGTERSYRTQSAAVEDDHREGPFGKGDLCPRHTPPETPCGRRVRAYAVRGNSEDSIEVLSTTDSIVPEDLQAITEEEDPEDPRTPYYSLEAEPVHRAEDGWDDGGDGGVVAAAAAVLRGERRELRGVAGDNGARWAPRAERDSPDAGETPGCTGAAPRGVRGETGEGRSAGGEGGRGEDGVPGEITDRRRAEEKVAVAAAAAPPSKSPSCLRAESAAAASDLHVKFASTALAAAEDAWSPPCTPTRTLSVDEASESTCSSKSPSQAHGDRRHDQRRRKRAGLRALRFIQRNSFSQQAVFCLLSGRPLVVMGGDEGSVRKLVSALTLFLPAAGPPDRTAVLPFLAKPLQLIDLLAWRLIGLHRTSSSASLAVLHSLARYSRYLALLDLDQRTLRCPAYSGSLIGQIANRHSSICKGRTYLLHLESCLTALANQALLYTFHPALRSGRDDIAGGEALLLERGFCSSEDDLRVMRFLSNLIKHYHAGRGPPILSVSYRQMQTHKHVAAP